MDAHLTLLSDAVSEFAEAFRLFDRMRNAKRSRVAATSFAQCIRALYIAVEKALKATIVDINPHLLIDQLDHKTLLALTKDLEAKPVPSLLLSRLPFETPSMLKSWDLIRQLRGTLVPSDAAESFERALKRLAETRHRAQHGEFLENRDTLLAMLEQVFQGTRPVLAQVAPTFYSELRGDYSHVDGRLRGLEQRLDGHWAAFEDFLSRRGSVNTSLELMVMNGGQQVPLRVLFETATDKYRTSFFLGPEIDQDKATGFFREILAYADPFDLPALLRKHFTPNPTRDSPPPTQPLVPIPSEPPPDPAVLDLSKQGGWLTFRLPGPGPITLNLRAWVLRFVISFPRGKTAKGTVDGVLLGPLVDEATEVPAVTITGSAEVVRETALRPGALERYLEGVTMRELRLTLTFKATTGRITPAA